ncbi:hypothetical protein BD414DRAFT_407372 [Trametes punicea]|nr:hypothetical protein BD414DRAFT_407372 [Trametes punicea]
MKPVSPAPLTTEPAPVSAPGSVISRVASPAQAPAAVSSSTPTSPTVPSLPSKPEADFDQKAVRRRRSRSPPAGPRHYVPTPPNATPPQTTQPTPSLPTKPEWTRRSTAPHALKTNSESPAPASTSEPADAGPIIPPYQPKPSVTADIEADIARIHAHRLHLEAEYVQMAAATRRALHEYDMSSIDLRMAVKRRELADAQLEKAQIGMLGLDYIP